MEDLTPQQRLLMRLRDERCGGNAAELARRIGKDASYINRLFYPPGKPGAKGIGLEIMQACSKAFNLPVGYWDGVTNLAWPFGRISVDRYLALDEAARAYVEGKLAAAIEQCEGSDGPKAERERLKRMSVQNVKTPKTLKKRA